MSVPSSPPQGDSASTAVDPKATDAEAEGNTAAAEAKGNSIDAEADPQSKASTLAPLVPADKPDYDPSQEDMAHEYVDYYVTNPVDRPKTPPQPDAHGQAAAGNVDTPDDAGNADTAADTPPPPTDETSPSATDGNGPVITEGNGPPNQEPPAAPPTTEGPAPYEDASLVARPNTPPVPSAASSSGPAAETPPPPEAKAMSLMDHLGELRTRLVRSAIVVALAFAATYSIADLIFAELMRPLLAALPPNSKLIFTALPEAFFVYLQVGFVAAIFLASPYIFYQIWGFIAPGLYDEEKKYAVPMALCSAFFFTLGAAFCFLVVFPFSFTFFVGFATEDIIPMPSLSEYLGFALKMLIAFGLIFEMPLFTFFLARMGLVSAAMMRKVRRYAILVIFIVAAILTPPDVMSQMLMAIPMLLLYEFSIFVAVAFGRKPKADSDADDSPEEKAAAQTASAGPKPADAATASASTDVTSASTDVSSQAPSAPQG